MRKEKLDNPKDIKASQADTPTSVYQLIKAIVVLINSPSDTNK